MKSLVKNVQGMILTNHLRFNLFVYSLKSSLFRCGFIFAIFLTLINLFWAFFLQKWSVKSAYLLLILETLLQVDLIDKFAKNDKDLLRMGL